MTSSDEGYVSGSDAATMSDPESQSAEARLRAGLSALDSLDARPLPEHALVYEGLHQDLQAVLAEIDGA